MRSLRSVFLPMSLNLPLETTSCSSFSFCLALTRICSSTCSRRRSVKRRCPPQDGAALCRSLYRPAGGQPVHHHALGLADAVAAVLRLQVHVRVPVAVEDDARVCRHEVDAEPACSQQHAVKSGTLPADTRLTPSPPARVESKKTSIDLSELKSFIACVRVSLR